MPQSIGSRRVRHYGTATTNNSHKINSPTLNVQQALPSRGHDWFGNI